MRYLFVAVLFAASCLAQSIHLPSSKTLGPVPGSPQKLNSFPATIALTPDGHYAAILNQGYGTLMSGLRQSIAIYDLRKMRLRDFPDDRFKLNARQTYWLGLAFSARGDELYASVASLSDPEGQKHGSTGNGIAVYSFHNGELRPSRFLKIPLQKLSPGKRFVYGTTKIPAGEAVPYPAGLAIIPAAEPHLHERLLIANNMSDNAVLLDTVTGEILKTFDLSTKDVVPAVYPHSVVVAPDGARAWVSLWNTSKIVELNLVSGNTRPLELLPNEPHASASGHSTAMVLDAARQKLYVALSNRDRVAVVDVASSTPVRTEPVGFLKVPGGAYPEGLAITPSGEVFATASGLNALVRLGKEPVMIPTQWYPTAVAIHGDDVLIVNAKGTGTGPNGMKPSPGSTRKKHEYIAVLLNGSLQHTQLTQIEEHASTHRDQVARSNNFGLKNARIPWHPSVRAKLSARLRTRGPIRHVIYIVKENRTYDQVFGDLPVGNGDKTLTLYGADVTPNQHKLALEFGVLDNFYDSGEISGNGHDWTMAAITSDYTERTWPVNYRGDERDYDYEGQVGGQTPMELGIPDINEPGTGFLWSLVARNHRTYRHYGEFINTRWCKAEPWANSPALTGTEQAACAGRKEVGWGEPLPPTIGRPKGGPSPWPWPVPMMASNLPTKPELVGHFDPNYPDFKMDYPDQLRVDEFLNEFDGFVAARQQGKKNAILPELVVVRLPNDHTFGTRAGMPTPAASVADNDLAVGRVVEAVSHSPYWDDTAILVLEDDAQDGPDHVDAHRSIALLISKYSPSSQRKPLVESRFYTTVNMIRTLEVLLGLPAMNLNDTFASPITSPFSGAGTHAPFTADRTNMENGLLYQISPPNNPGAAASAQLDFSQADSANAATLNAILWQDRKGNTPMPKPKHH